MLHFCAWHKNVTLVISSVEGVGQVSHFLIIFLFRLHVFAREIYRDDFLCKEVRPDAGYGYNFRLYLNYVLSNADL